MGRGRKKRSIKMMRKDGQRRKKVRIKAKKASSKK